MPTQSINIQTGAIQNFISGLNFANPSWDTMLIAFFLGAAVLYGMTLGRDRLIVIMLSAYMSLGIINALPEFVLKVNIEKFFAFQITTFVGVFIILFFMLSRSALLRTIGAHASQGKFWQVLLLSFLHIGMIISIALSYLPPQIGSNFSPELQALFTGEWARFIWIIAPVFAMLIMRDKEE